jgi:hypothetical protein
VNDLQAAYRFLKITAFHDMRLPARVRIEARPLRNAWGYYYDNKKIEIDSRIKTWDKRLKVLAHEMVSCRTRPSWGVRHIGTRRSVQDDSGRGV